MEYVLNFFPVTVQGPAHVYVTKRANHGAKAAFEQRYQGWAWWPDKADGDRLYTWSHDAATQVPPGFEPVTVELTENPHMFGRLLLDAVAHRMSSLGFQRRGRNGFVNWAIGNLLRNPSISLGEGEPIGLYPKIVIDAFFTSFAGEVPTLGILVDVLYTTKLDIPVAELLAAGLDVAEWHPYVVLLPNTPEADIDPDLVGKAIGRVAFIAGQNVELEDSRNPTLRSVRTKSVALEPRREYLDAYLEARLKGKYQKGKQDLIQRLRLLTSPGERYRLTKAAVKQRLTAGDTPGERRPLILLPDLLAHVGDMQRVSWSDARFAATTYEPPVYSFDPTGNRIWSGRVDDGLRKYGPYTERKLKDTAHHILMISPEKHKGTVQRAISQFRSGVNIPGKKPVFTGFGHMYRLHELYIDECYFPVPNQAPMRGYQDALHEALMDAARKDHSYDLVLIVIEDDYRRLPDSENPYYQCKAYLLTASGIPSQHVTISKLRSSDQNLQYILNTVALSCYAKMGGTPFVLRKQEIGPCELVFGVGRAVLKESRFGGGEQVIGFSTVFRANGEYIYNDCTPYCDSDDYALNLEETIRRSVEEVAGFEQLQDGAQLRLVFHMYKETGRRDVRAVLNAVRKLTRYQIEFALLHINDNHHFMLFDEGATSAESAEGKNSTASRKEMADYLPKRGTVVSLGPRERLVVVRGTEQYRGYGCPTILRITLNRASTYRDIDELARQVFELSFMNARSLSPSYQPVTILYAEYLAAMVGHLQGVQKWSVSLIQQKLGRRLWFI